MHQRDLRNFKKANINVSALAPNYLFTHCSRKKCGLYYTESQVCSEHFDMKHMGISYMQYLKKVLLRRHMKIKSLWGNQGALRQR